MLIDWVRLIDPPLNGQNVNRVAKILRGWTNSPATIREFSVHVDPQLASLTTLILEPVEEFLESFRYEILSDSDVTTSTFCRPVLDCAVTLMNREEFQRPDLQKWLTRLVFTERSVSRPVHAARLLLHKLQANIEIADAVLTVLINIIRQSRTYGIYDASAFAELLFSGQIGLLGVAFDSIEMSDS